jgi:hypothetical protein
LKRVFLINARSSCFQAFCEAVISSSAGKSTKGSIKQLQSLAQRGGAWEKCAGINDGPVAMAGTRLADRTFCMSAPPI